MPAGAIDSELPKPPHSVHLMLGSKASWVEPQVGQTSGSWFGEVTCLASLGWKGAAVEIDPRSRQQVAMSVMA